MMGGLVGAPIPNFHALLGQEFPLTRHWGRNVMGSLKLVKSCPARNEAAIEPSDARVYRSGVPAHISSRPGYY